MEDRRLGEARVALERAGGEYANLVTGRRVVQRIITDLAVIDVTPEGLVLVELAPGTTVEEVQEQTEPKLLVPDAPVEMGC